MTGKNKGSHDQGYGSAADPASTGQQTKRVPLWSRPMIPADDPIYKAGFGVGERRSTPLSIRSVKDLQGLIHRTDRGDFI
jgi:hypothetical protein